MIKVTRLNQTEFILNADLIEFVEQTPDTVITMLTGRKVLVRESVEEVVRRVLAYRREVGPTITRLDRVRAEVALDTDGA
jgi:flagellar protein FlbD